MIKIKNKYWNSKKSDNYSEFNLTIPSEIVAYDVVYNIFDIKGKKVLDFGSYKGNSSLNILKKGASKVVGVDSSKRNIRISNKSNNDKRLEFQHVEESKDIITKDKFDLCFKTFVHPTINKKDILLKSYKKINKVLEKGGYLIILGLNPEIFGEYKNNFISYDFNKNLTNKKIKDGDVFKNNLFNTNGDILKLEDYFWTEKTMKKLMEKSGFSIERVINVSESNLDGKEKELFSKKKKDIEEEYLLKWKDEWNSGLYQIIIAKKTN